MAEEGINRIRQELDTVNFPVTKDELMNRMGDRQVQAGNRQMRMRDVIGKMQKDRYESKDALIQDIEQNVPEFQNR